MSSSHEQKIEPKTASRPPGAGSWRMRAAVPIVVGLVLLAVPPPAGLSPHAWHFFAIFAAVIAGCVTEPIPSAAIGLIGVALAATFAPWTLFSAADLAKPGFRMADEALKWALLGFSDTIVWLIFAAFIFSQGYEKTGLGRRIALWLVRALGGKTLSLGYAVAFSDTVLAPFTPSNTARSGGSVYPVIKNLPALYDSLPNDPSMRRIGSYLMWCALATTCVTSSMFLTGVAPNVLALSLIRSNLHVQVTWLGWFWGFLPVGILLLLATPWLAYVIYPPEVKNSPEVPVWAAAELDKLGPMQRGEKILAGLVILALVLWVFGGAHVAATTAALIVVAGMLLSGTLTWNDILANKPAWNTLIWFGTMVTLATGLSRVGVVKWLAALLAGAFGHLSVAPALIALVAAFFILHYLFASLTAHTTALLPPLLLVAAAVPGMNVMAAALALSMTIGMMGVIDPYATGPGPIYAGSGFLPAADFWRLGAIFGAIYLVTFLVIGVPWLLWVA